MDREYMDEALQRLATDPGFQPEGWSAQEIEDFRVLVQCARAARLVTDLRNSRMLRIQPRDGREFNKARTTLRSGRVVHLTFKSAESQSVVIFELLTPEMDTLR